MDAHSIKRLLSQDLMDLFVRLGLVTLLVVFCVKVFSPFLSLLLWSLVLAVTLYPLHRFISGRLGGKQGRSATVIVLIGLLIIWVPIVMLGFSATEYAAGANTLLKSQSLVIPPPNPAVAEWPLIGKKVFGVWTKAAENLPELIKTAWPQIERLIRGALAMTASLVGAVLQFLVSLIIAGIMLAYAEAGSAAMLRIARRLAGPAKGPSLYVLSTATIRSVAAGVIGVALIQALIVGVGFIWAGIPGAALLAMFVLLLGIAQLPAVIITLPAIGYLWWAGDSTGANLFFTLYLVVGGMADNVLKPLLLGRGVDAPMPVILLGALGGMVTSGMIGLFLGAVLLAVGYQLFMDWVDESGEPDAPPEAAAPENP